MNATNAIDVFLGSLGLTPLLIPLPQTPENNDDSLLLSPPPPPPLARTRRFQPDWSDGEEGIDATDCELHRYIDEYSVQRLYCIRKVNNEFYVYYVLSESPLRRGDYVGKAVRGPDGDGPLNGIDTTVEDPERPVVSVLFPSMAISFATS
jgi:hypothetical protein